MKNKYITGLGNNVVIMCNFMNTYANTHARACIQHSKRKLLVVQGWVVTVYVIMCNVMNAHAIINMYYVTSTKKIDAVLYFPSSEKGRGRMKGIETKMYYKERVVVVRNPDRHCAFYA